MFCHKNSYSKTAETIILKLFKSKKQLFFSLQVFIRVRQFRLKNKIKNEIVKVEK